MGAQNLTTGRSTEAVGRHMWIAPVRDEARRVIRPTAGVLRPGEFDEAVEPVVLLPRR